MSFTRLRKFYFTLLKATIKNGDRGDWSKYLSQLRKLVSHGV